MIWQRLWQHCQWLMMADSSPVARVAMALVRGYQKNLSPLKLGSTCRFEPTCSAYALRAIESKGAAIGITLTLVRLIKCGPWHPGGYDPPPGWDDRQTFG